MQPTKRRVLYPQRSLRRGTRSPWSVVLPSPRRCRACRSLPRMSVQGALAKPAQLLALARVSQRAAGRLCYHRLRLSDLPACRPLRPAMARCSRQLLEFEQQKQDARPASPPRPSPAAGSRKPAPARQAARTCRHPAGLPPQSPARTARSLQLPTPPRVRASPGRVTPGYGFRSRAGPRNQAFRRRAPAQRPQGSRCRQPLQMPRSRRAGREGKAVAVSSPTTLQEPCQPPLRAARLGVVA